MAIKKITIKNDVYRVLCRLHEAGRLPHREVIREELAISQNSVDAALATLFNTDCLIDRIAKGTYIPKKKKRPDRAITTTVIPDIPDSVVKCEVGDKVLDLSLTEARLFAQLLWGLVVGYGK